MKNIDMDIFNSLPPEIQNEVNSPEHVLVLGDITRSGIFYLIRLAHLQMVLFEFVSVE